MPTFRPPVAKLRVFTEKEGLLSAVAHDLELEATRFEVQAQEGSISATVDPTSLRVLHAMKGGLPTAALSERDKADIERNLRGDVLQVAKYPTIAFASTSFRAGPHDGEATGRLTLHGTTKSVTLRARVRGEEWVAEVTLHQPDFGIRPYSAMLGTLKVKPSVRVEMVVPRW